jgi:predicted N-formylglutamate amidohydrolase
MPSAGFRPTRARLARLEWLITCEHASCAIPPQLEPQFKNFGKLLKTHRGWDIGALALAKSLAKTLRAKGFYGDYSRLVVDLNRHASNPSVFSEFTRGLSRQEKRQLIATYHEPYRTHIRRWVKARTQQGKQVVHVSVHSFTPVLRGQRRAMDIGLLYDPGRSSEKAFCREWKRALAAQGWKVTLNRPYRGISDGITTWLRRFFGPRLYLGIELEVNNRWLGR